MAISIDTGSVSGSHRRATRTSNESMAAAVVAYLLFGQRSLHCFALLGELVATISGFFFWVARFFGDGFCARLGAVAVDRQLREQFLELARALFFDRCPSCHRGGWIRLVGPVRIDEST
ncbi:MAG: hypothetical protein AAF735_07800 [Myxococcota bacterium]